MCTLQIRIALSGFTPERILTFWAENPYAGIHTFADATNRFNQDYMIISVPRFILIGPDGKIINSNAPRPSGQIRQVLETLEI